MMTSHVFCAMRIAKKQGYIFSSPVRSVLGVGSTWDLSGIIIWSFPNDRPSKNQVCLEGFLGDFLFGSMAHMEAKEWFNLSERSTLLQSLKVTFCRRSSSAYVQNEGSLKSIYF